MDPARVDRCGHDIDELLGRKADGRLSGEDAPALDRHTASCAACRERAALLDWAADGLRQDRIAVPAHLADETMRRVRGLEAARARRAPGPVTVRRWLPAAAALAVGIGAFVVIRSDGRAPTATPTPVRVDLRLADAGARSVAVAGDFNGWDAAAMTKGPDGVFRIQLSLEPGRYQYSFLVDERTWVPDPLAATTIDSGYGGADSILDLTL